jgi:hypothetical protein
MVNLQTVTFIDLFVPLIPGRGVRVVEGARLESVYTGNCIAGSNPALSAKPNHSPMSFLMGIFILWGCQPCMCPAKKKKPIFASRETF